MNRSEVEGLARQLVMTQKQLDLAQEQMGYALMLVHAHLATPEAPSAPAEQKPTPETRRVFTGRKMEESPNGSQQEAAE